MNWFENPRHPIWSIVRLSILMVTLCAVLFVTATNFDYTEIRTIIATFIGAAGTEGAVSRLLVEKAKTNRP